MAAYQKWLTTAEACGVHVIPLADAVDHSRDDDGSMGWLVTHHSLDGREASE